MRISPVSYELARYYVMSRIRASDPLFIKIQLPMVKGHPPIVLFFLLDWWGKHNTYIARQVLPTTDFVGEFSYEFVYPRFDERWRKVLKRKLRTIVAVRHVADAVKEKSSEQMFAQLGVRVISKA